MGLSDLFSDIVSSMGFTEAHAEAPPAEDAEAGADAEKTPDEDPQEDEPEEEEEEEEEEEPVDPKPALEEGEFGVTLYTWCAVNCFFIRKRKTNKPP